jgi:hypothetical protein
MREPVALQLRELLNLMTVLLNRVQLAADRSERTAVLKNLRFLLDLADEEIEREFPTEYGALPYPPGAVVEETTDLSV